MMPVATRDEAERRLAEAMRAQAIGAGRPGFVGRNPSTLGAPPTDPIRPHGPAVTRPPVQGPANQAATGHATGAAAPAAQPWAGSAGVPAGPPGLWAVLVSTRFPLLLALLGGVVLGIALALLSLLVPGALPTLG